MMTLRMLIDVVIWLYEDAGVKAEIAITRSALRKIAKSKSPNCSNYYKKDNSEARNTTIQERVRT